MRDVMFFAAGFNLLKPLPQDKSSCPCSSREFAVFLNLRSYKFGQFSRNHDCRDTA